MHTLRLTGPWAVGPDVATLLACSIKCFALLISRAAEASWSPAEKAKPLGCPELSDPFVLPVQLALPRKPRAAPRLLEQLWVTLPGHLPVGTLGTELCQSLSTNLEPQRTAPTSLAATLWLEVAGTSWSSWTGAMGGRQSKPHTGSWMPGLDAGPGGSISHSSCCGDTVCLSVSFQKTFFKQIFSSLNTNGDAVFCPL